jgi:hypothetical protein
LVTAKHIIDGIGIAGSFEVLIRFNFKDGQARWVSSRLSDWKYHPTEAATVDVAVLPLQGIGLNVDHGVFPILGFATSERVAIEEIGLGEETFIVGLFANHYGNAKNIPVVRIGNIAAMLEEKVTTQLGLIDAYLIEARSIGGLSGSPVFVNLGKVREHGGNVEFHTSSAIYLLGLIHGHYDTEDERARDVNMGIAMVVPAVKILEVLDQEDFVNYETQLRKRHEG